MTSLRSHACAWLVGAALVPLASSCANTFDPSLFLPLADDCTEAGEISALNFPAGASEHSYAIDTRTLRNDIDDTTACLGRRAEGPEGFLRVDMSAGERWHFHMRRTGNDDPALYVLPSCDVRQCTAQQSIDICGQGADEHLTFEAPTSGSYLIAVDSVNSEGVSGMLQIIRPTCGNGTREHSETCDDGNETPGDGCDASCRRELTDALRAEVEVNDDMFSANHILLTANELFVTGRIASTCESDWFAVDVAAGQTIEAALLTSTETECPSDRPASIDLEILRPSGQDVIARGIATTGCPSIAPTAALSTAGRYFVRVFARNDEVARPFDYGLRVRVQ